MSITKKLLIRHGVHDVQVSVISRKNHVTWVSCIYRGKKMFSLISSLLSTIAHTFVLCTHTPHTHNTFDSTEHNNAHCHFTNFKFVIFDNVKQDGSL